MLRPATPTRPAARLLAGLVLALTAATGCSADDAPAGDDGTTVALLLADDTRSRLQARDVPAFEQRLARACPECSLVTHVAGGDPELQAEQLAESLEEGADAVVLQATSAAAGAELVEQAGEVPVVAYDRPIAGVDHVVAGDGAALGTLQAATVTQALGADARGARVLLVGLAGDAGEEVRRRALRAGLRAAGARAVPVEVGDASAEAARAAATAQLAAGRVDAVAAATDVQAAGAVAALGRRDAVVVGADADLDGVRRLVTGAQDATAWTDERALATRAADVAVALARGEEVPEPAATTQATEVAGVPADLVTPLPVTLDDVARLLVRRDVVTIEEVCDAATAPACQQAGLA